MAIVLRIQRRPLAGADGPASPAQQLVNNTGGPRQPSLTPQEQEAAAQAGPAADFERARQVVIRNQASAATTGGTQQRGAVGGASTAAALRGGDVPRVFQLDGEEIDRSISKTLLDQLTGAMDLIDTSFPYRRADEIRLLLSCVLYRFSVWEKSQSFGDKLVNVVYRDERVAMALGRGETPFAVSATVPSKRLKLLHAIATILLPYVFRKVERAAAEGDWANLPSTAAAAASAWKVAVKRWVGLVVERTGPLLSALDVVNFLAFLSHGQYRNLVDRLLGMRLVHGRQRMVKHVSLYYVNQAILWQVLLSFASVVLPLINLGRVWATLAAPWSRIAGSPVAVADRSVEACAFCRQPLSGISMPRRLAPCRHIACYYCIASRAAAAAARGASDEPRCPRCELSVVSHAALSADSTARVAADVEPHGRGD